MCRGAGRINIVSPEERREGRTLSAGVVWPLHYRVRLSLSLSLAPSVTTCCSVSRVCVSQSEWPGPGAPRVVREKVPRLAAEVSKNRVIAISNRSVFLVSKLETSIEVLD